MVSAVRPDLAPVRRAHELLRSECRVDDIIDELRSRFELDFVGGMAAVAASFLLTEGGLTVPEEPFTRPYVSRQFALA
jgi:hypothetical protein